MRRIGRLFSAQFAEIGISPPQIVFDSHVESDFDSDWHGNWFLIHFCWSESPGANGCDCKSEDAIPTMIATKETPPVSSLRKFSFRHPNMRGARVSFNAGGN